MRRVGVLAGAAPLVLATFLVSGAPAQADATAKAAQRVFVSPAGHSGATGTRQDPLASVNEAVDRLTDGGVVLLRWNWHLLFRY